MFVPVYPGPQPAAVRIGWIGLEQRLSPSGVPTACPPVASNSLGRQPALQRTEFLAQDEYLLLHGSESPFQVYGAAVQCDGLLAKTVGHPGRL